jgi:hypothetical protein
VFILWGNVGPRHMQPIQRIPDAGGSPVPVPGTAGHSPRFLPDGRRFVYIRGGLQNHDLSLGSLDPNDKPRRIGEVGDEPTYSAATYFRSSTESLMARSFDLARAEFTGESFPPEGDPGAARPYGLPTN